MFKMTVMVTALVLGLAGCAQQQTGQAYSAADLAREQQASYDRTRDGVATMIVSGEITPKQGAQRMATYVRTAYPQDYDIQDLWNYSVLVFSKQEKGELSEDEAGYLIQKKANEHEQKWQAKKTQYNAASAQQGQPNMAPYIFLQSMGNSSRNAYSPAGQRQCSTTSVGGVYTTNCY
ncbi:hypothetical protein [Achromobacter ruhlandii]|uniref:hypothetical protein n=1 Tax=Achromobacter ruhlandii TaxID=72557 RepID=UPI0007BF6870|nr:hypothetical protein [Achromobacter ruhlandii]